MTYSPVLGPLEFATELLDLFLGQERDGLQSEGQHIAGIEEQSRRTSTAFMIVSSSVVNAVASLSLNIESPLTSLTLTSALSHAISTYI